MIEIPLWLLVLVGIALVVVIFIESREYKKFHIAVNNLDVTYNATKALAAGTQVSFEGVTTVVNGLIETVNNMALDLADKDRRIAIMGSIIDTHSDILSLRMLQALITGEGDEIGAEKDSNGAVLGA